MTAPSARARRFASLVTRECMGLREGQSNCIVLHLPASSRISLAVSVESEPRGCAAIGSSSAPRFSGLVEAGERWWGRLSLGGGWDHGCKTMSLLLSYSTLWMQCAAEMDLFLESHTALEARVLQPS